MSNPSQSHPSAPLCPGAPPRDPPPPYSPPHSVTGSGGYPVQQYSSLYPSGYPPHTTQPVGHPARMYPPQGQPYPTVHPNPAASQYPGAAYPQQPMQTYYVPGAFDAGARFMPGQPVNIPPPPPGVAPNAAQLAAMQQNATVVLGQKKPDRLFGGREYTFW